MQVSVSGGQKYRAALQKIAALKLGVKAGIFKGATTTDGKSIPEYAAYNEFGTSRIPARPFMRQTLETKQDSWKSFLGNALDYDEISKNQAENAMGLLGEVMKADIQQTIQKGSFVPNSPKTIARKRAKGKVEPDHPLIDTGQMLAAVGSEVIHG